MDPSSEGRKKHLDAEYIVNIWLSKSNNRLTIGCERKEDALQCSKLLRECTEYTAK